MSIGLPKDVSLIVTVYTTDGEYFSFSEANTRADARDLARALLTNGFNIDHRHNLPPGEEVYYPCTTILKVRIHR